MRLKSFCTTNDTIIKAKQQLTAQEKHLYQLPSDRGLVSRLHKEPKNKLDITKQLKWAMELNIDFSKDQTQMAEKHLKNHSTSLVIREMQIKSTLTFLLPTFIMAKANKTILPGCRGRGAFIHCWWECTLVKPLQKSVWRFLKKLDPATTEIGIHPCYYRNTCSSLCIAALFIITMN